MMSQRTQGNHANEVALGKVSLLIWQDQSEKKRLEVAFSIVDNIDDNDI